MPLRFSVFGDVHGRVPLMILLSRAWQEANDEPLDGILQVGDMGAFPDHRKLDKATARHARDDPDELDFVHFLSATELAVRLLGDDDTPPIAFCRGNHEDFEFLSRYRHPTALDPFSKLWFVPDGEIMHWRAERTAVRIGAFGGAPPLRESPAGRGRKARAARRRAVHRSFGLRWQMGPRFSPDQATSAFRDGQPIDVLLTHGGPEHPAFPHGCAHLSRLVERIRPRAHLFGHHHQVVGPVTESGSCLVGLEHLEFLRDGSLRPGSWGILTLDDGCTDFEWMNAPEHSWMTPFRRKRWRHLLER